MLVVCYCNQNEYKTIVIFILIRILIKTMTKKSKQLIEVLSNYAPQQRFLPIHTSRQTAWPKYEGFLFNKATIVKLDNITY